MTSPSAPHQQRQGASDGVVLAGGREGGGDGGGDPGDDDGTWEDEDSRPDFEQELWDLERELDEAHEAKGVAERVNMQLKSAIEAQSLEIETLRAKISSTERWAIDSSGTMLLSNNSIMLWPVVARCV